MPKKNNLSNREILIKINKILDEWYKWETITRSNLDKSSSDTIFCCRRDLENLRDEVLRGE